MILLNAKIILLILLKMTMYNAHNKHRELTGKSLKINLLTYNGNIYKG